MVTAATVWAAKSYDGSAHLLWWLQLPLIPLGAAQGAIFAPLISAVMHAVPHRMAGLTGGLISTAQQTALALGVALVGTAYVALACNLGWAVAFAVTLVGQAMLSVAILVSARALRHAIGRRVPPG